LLLLGKKFKGEGSPKRYGSHKASISRECNFKEVLEGVIQDAIYEKFCFGFGFIHEFQC
jgi:hypothetical protein